MHKKHIREYTKKYIHENIPRKRFSRGFVIRKRRPFEIFWSEILFAIFIVALLVMLTMNYVSNRNYIPQNRTAEPPKEVGITVTIKKESNLAAPVYLSMPVPIVNYL